MKILITNIAFSAYAGTEIVVRDLAIAFARAGHQPIVFSPTLGPIAEEVRQAGIQVVDTLSQIESAPDIIHGHHHPVLAEALLWFPQTPAIYLSHDATSAIDAPCSFPRILRFFAVDLRCQARVERVLGDKAGVVGIMPNAVDLQRFPSRRPLPPQPRRALVFSNNASRRTHLRAVRRASRIAGLELDVIGEAAGRRSTDPGKLLGDYDLVFGKARCALEALAAGNAVVLCDSAGAGTYVTTGELDQLRAMNFGAGLLTHNLDPGWLVAQVARYDPQDAAAASLRIRQEASLEHAAAHWLRLYREVIAGFDPAAVNRLEESRAFAKYLVDWHYLKRRQWEWEQLERLKTISLIGNPAYRLASWALRKQAARPGLRSSRESPTMEPDK